MRPRIRSARAVPGEASSTALPRLGPATLKGIGVGTVIAAVHLDAPNPVALSHRSAQRRLEFVPMPATGAWGGPDEEVDQLVEERLLGVAPPLSRESGH